MGTGRTRVNRVFIEFVLYDPQRKGKMPKDQKHRGISHWLVPSLMSGVISIAAIAQGYLVATSAQQQVLEIETSKQRIEISKLRIQIIDSVNRYDFDTAGLLLKCRCTNSAFSSLSPRASALGFTAFRLDEPPVAGDERALRGIH